MEYFDDIRKPRKLKKTSQKNANFFVGDIVTVGGSHGTVIYGPYVGDNNKATYEVEMEDGDIITIIDDGKSIVKYSSPENLIDIDEDDNF